MPVATVATMVDVLSGLKNQLGDDDPSLGPICTRVTLRTGVDLRAPRPDQDRTKLLVTVSTLPAVAAAEAGEQFVRAFGGLPMAGFHTDGETWLGHVDQTLTGVVFG